MFLWRCSNPVSSRRGTKKRPSSGDLRCGHVISWKVFSILGSQVGRPLYHSTCHLYIEQERLSSLVLVRRKYAQSPLLMTSKAFHIIRHAVREAQHSYVWDEVLRKHAGVRVKGAEEDDITILGNVCYVDLSS